MPSMSVCEGSRRHLRSPWLAQITAPAAAVYTLPLLVAVHAAVHLPIACLQCVTQQCNWLLLQQWIKVFIHAALHKSTCRLTFTSNDVMGNHERHNILCIVRCDIMGMFDYAFIIMQ